MILGRRGLGGRTRTCKSGMLHLLSFFLRRRRHFALKANEVQCCLFLSFFFVVVHCALPNQLCVLSRMIINGGRCLVSLGR